MYVLDPIEPSGIVENCVDNHAVKERKVWHDGIRAHLFGTGFERTGCVCIAQWSARSSFGPGLQVRLPTVFQLCDF